MYRVEARYTPHPVLLAHARAERDDMEAMWGEGGEGVPTHSPGIGLPWHHVGELPPNLFQQLRELAGMQPTFEGLQHDPDFKGEPARFWYLPAEPGGLREQVGAALLRDLTSQLGGERVFADSLASLGRGGRRAFARGRPPGECVSSPRLAVGTPSAASRTSGARLGCPGSYRRL